MNLYTAKDVQQRADKVTKRQLIHWVEVGAIIPHQEDRRRGGKRLFNQQNLIEALICRELNEARLPSAVFVGVLVELRLRHRKLGDKKVSFWETLPHRKELPFIIIRRLEVEVRTGGKVKKTKDIASAIVLANKKNLAKELSVFPSAVVVNLPHLVQEAGGI